MASTPVTIQTFDKLLKEFYLSQWVDQLNSMTTTWQYFRRRLVDFSGRKMIFPVRTGRNAGVGAVATSHASASLPTLIEAGRQRHDQASVVPRLVMGALELSQDVIDISKNDRGAFFQAIDVEMAGLVQDVAELMDRMVYGDGGGRLAFIASGGSSVTVIPVTYIRPFFIGQRIDIWSANASGSTLRSAGNEITAITNNADGSGSITVGTTVATTDEDGIITTAGARPTATTGVEWLGIDALISNTNPPLESTFQGITRTGNSFWHSHVNTTAVLSEKTIQQALDTTHDDSMGEVNALFANRMTRFALYETLALDNPRRLVNTNVIQPGMLSGKLEDHRPDTHDYLMFDGRVPIIVDKFCPVKIDNAGATQGKSGTMFGLDMSSVYVALVTDFKWWDGGQGTILRPSASRKFGLEAVLYTMGNLVCDAPNKNFKLPSLTIG